jgi:hypothetical protein
VLFFIFCYNFFCIRLQTYAHTLMDVQQIKNCTTEKESRIHQKEEFQHGNKQTNKQTIKRKKVWKQHTNNQIDRQNRKKREKPAIAHTRAFVPVIIFSLWFFVLGQNRNAKLDEYHWEDVPMHSRNNCKTIRKWDGEQIKN